ncbi:hypothetical protein DYH09_28440 [bacterium CPR1]|nr:hypothetical protein [bacterium CPR1]
MEETEEDGPPRRAAWPLVLTLLVTLALGAVVAYHTTRPEPVASPAEARPGPNDMEIVPGHRVDVVTLGLDVVEVERRWGKALIRPAEGGLVYQFDQLGVSMMTSEGRVSSILVKNPAFRTRGGSAVQGDVDTVIREFGKAFELEQKPGNPDRVQYWDKGIHFTVEKTVISSIQVSEPVLAPSPHL